MVEGDDARGEDLRLYELQVRIYCFPSLLIFKEPLEITLQEIFELIIRQFQETLISKEIMTVPLKNAEIPRTVDRIGENLTISVEHLQTIANKLKKEKQTYHLGKHVKKRLTKFYEVRSVYNDVHLADMKNRD